MLIFEIIVFNFACLYVIAAKWLNLLRPPKVYDQQKYENLLKKEFSFYYFLFNRQWTRFAKGTIIIILKFTNDWQINQQHKAKISIIIIYIWPIFRLLRTATSSLRNVSWWPCSLPPTTAGSSTTPGVWWVLTKHSCVLSR